VDVVKQVDEVCRLTQMQQVTDNYWSGEVKLEEVCAPTAHEGGVLVRTAFSLISAGTERMKVQQSQMSLVGKARARPDQVRRVLESLAREGAVATYRKVMNQLKTPVPLGYSLSGEVVAVGVGAEMFRIGNRVACAGSSANHAELNFVPKNLCVKVPDDVSLESAACTTVGSIALHGVRQANPQIGDVVVVLGLGLVGQFCVQLLIASGCKVLGIDLDPVRLELATKFGAHRVSQPERHEAVVHLADLSAGIGADIILLTASGSNPEPVRLAAELARDRGRIVDVGKTALDLPWEIFYEKELELRMSRSYGPGRYDPSYEENGIDYPAGYVRWTENRNMELFLDLVKSGQVQPQALVTHRIAFAEAERAYQLLLDDKSALGILLEYDSAHREPERRIVLSAKPRKPSQQLGLGVIGAGNFCKSMLLPHLSREPKVQMMGICTATGISSKDTAKRFDFKFATCDPQEVLRDPDINSVLIATPHDLHAPLAAAALRAGKRVFVEKPLALEASQVKELERICGEENPALMVGYNRRFAPHVQELARWMRSQPSTWIATYRVNAGRLPADHWYHDPEKGGGRLLGEVCHFVDLLIFLFGSYPERVSAESAYALASKNPLEDNAVYTLCFQSGSVAHIVYTAEGDSSVGKEHLEVIGNGGVATIEDFRHLKIVQNGKKREWRSWMPDKGHKQEMHEFVRAATSGSEMPIPLADLWMTSYVCFALRDALQSGGSIRVELAG
jgi:predicted dehydrogenase/threonine dehydrogenase-like Zn-dependent dehydrogenase